MLSRFTLLAVQTHLDVTIPHILNPPHNWLLQTHSSPFRQPLHYQPAHWRTRLCTFDEFVIVRCVCTAITWWTAWLLIKGGNSACKRSQTGRFGPGINPSKCRSEGKACSNHKEFGDVQTANALGCDAVVENAVVESAWDLSTPHTVVTTTPDFLPVQSLHLEDGVVPHSSTLSSVVQLILARKLVVRCRKTSWCE